MEISQTKLEQRFNLCQIFVQLSSIRNFFMLIIEKERHSSKYKSFGCEIT